MTPPVKGANNVVSKGTEDAAGPCAWWCSRDCGATPPTKHMTPRPSLKVTQAVGLRLSKTVGEGLKKTLGWRVQPVFPFLWAWWFSTYLPFSTQG